MVARTTGTDPAEVTPQCRAGKGVLDVCVRGVCKAKE
jgi:hypothetical protein